MFGKLTAASTWFVLLVPVEVRERPPMLTVPAYRAKFGRELSA
jgi:hypothetical protein